MRPRRVFRQPKSSPTWALPLLSLAGLASLLLATFANYVLRELGHDEGMYLGASYLAVDHELYREVAYFQAPNLPLLLSRFYEWAGVSEQLLWGRIVTFAHHGALLVILTTLAWHFIRSSALSFLFTMWIGFNGFLFGSGYSIDSTTFASTYLLAGFGALLRAHERAWSSSWLALAGFLAALAPGFKLNYLPLYACFVAAIVLYAPRRTLGYFLLGSFVGFGPVLYLLVDRPDVFWFDNVTWHRRLLAMNAEVLGTGAIARGFVSDAWFYLTRVSWLATFVVLVPSAIFLLVRERQPWWSFERTLLGLLVGVSLVTIVGLGAVRFWYLQPTAIAAALIIPSVYCELRPRRRAVLRWLLLLAAAVSVSYQAPALREATHVFDVARWVPLRYSRMGNQIAQLAPREGTGSVAVLGNPAIVYGVEGELSLTSSAATGAFVRVSSPMMERLSRANPRIATYDELSRRDLQMVIATVDYVTPRRDVEPSAWCDSELPDERAKALVEVWCASFANRRVVGEGPARAVVFHR